MSRGVAWAWVAVVALGCGSTKHSTSSTGSGGSMAQPQGFTINFGPVEVAPGIENTQCIVARLGNPKPIHVGQIHNVLGDASHHMIVYRVTDTTEQLTPFDCHPFTDVLDPTKGSTMMVSQKKDDLLSLPPGVGYTLDANQMLRIEVHYINAGTTPAKLTASTTMVPISDAAFKDEAGFLFIGDADIVLPPNTSTTLGPVFFGLPDTYASAKFFAITGHEHKLGTDVEVSVAANKTDPGMPVYSVPNWQWSEPATVVPATPFSVPAGGGFSFTCKWNNTTSAKVKFGEATTDEMCFFWAYYYPSVGANVCIHTDQVQGGFDFCCPGAPQCAAFFGMPAAANCNNIPNASAAIPLTQVPMAPPAPTGGTIPDGTYVLQQANVYTGVGGKSGPTGQTYALTAVLSAGTFQNVLNDSSSPGNQHSGGKIATNGTALLISELCPSPQTLPFNAYSTDGVSSFIIYGPNGPVTSEFVFAKM